MKKRIGYICLLVGFLLIGCTFLSHRVENVMMTQAVVWTLKGSNVILPDSVLFKDSGMPVMYAAEGGLGWNIGLRADEVPSRVYEVLGDGRLQLDSAYMDLVYTASREPIVGQRINRLDADKRETGPDQYLVIYSNGVPKKHELPSDLSLVKRSDSVMLLDAAEAKRPFMEHEVKGKFDSIWGLQWKIYSLTDLRLLVGSLPLIALAAVLAVIPVMLFLLGACLPPKITDRDMMFRFHMGFGILALAGVIVLINAIQLPFSLMPTDMIFQWEHYTAELQTAMAALEQVGDTTIGALYAQKQTEAVLILGAGGVALIITLAVSVALYKKTS